MSPHKPLLLYCLLWSASWIFLAFQQPFSLKTFSVPDYQIDIDQNQGRYPFTQSKPEMQLRIGNLEMGAEYSVYLLAGVRNVACVPDFVPLHPESRVHRELMVTFTATGKHEDFLIHTECRGEFSPFDYRVSVVKHEEEAPANSPFSGPDMPPAIATNSNVPVEDLVLNSLIAGNCFDVMNISATGHPNSNGTFENGATSINFDRGVILSTGNIANATGPNNAPNRSTNFFSFVGDADLAMISNAALRDVAVLEFDFTPTSEQITFRYVFASEEYCEYVNSVYNDVFGFFLSGPGINGPFSNNAVNIAQLTNGTVVAINNVNHLSNSAFYVSNIPPGQPNCNNTGHPLAGPPATLDCQFDGFTVVLTATANVIPCETYHIKLAIADVGDNIFDSAVFLEESSFGFDGLVAVDIEGSVPDTNLVYEGCTAGCFVFTRTGGDLSQDVIVQYYIDSLSTATPGVDYVPLPDTIIIPAGMESICVPIYALADTLTEGPESIILYVENSCSCETQFVELFIYELQPFSLQLDDAISCLLDTMELLPLVEGGLPGYTYLWSTGDSIPNLTVSPDTPTTYHLTVTDACGFEVEQEALVAIYTSPTAEYAAERILCSSGGPSDMEVTVTFTGIAPWMFSYSIDGAAQTPVITSDNPFTFTVPNDADVELLSLQSEAEGCVGEVYGEITVKAIQLELSGSSQAVSCFNGSDGSASVTVAGGDPAYTYLWSNNGVGASLSGLPPGTYQVSIFDANGCEADTSFVILNQEEILMTVSDIILVDCNIPLGGATVEASGGVGDYTYLWSHGISDTNPTNLSPGTYSVLATDANGCEATVSVFISSDTELPLADAGPNLTLDCTTDTVQLQASASQGANYTFEWSSPDGQIQSGANTLEPIISQPGLYELLVINHANGCSATSSVSIAQDTTTPTVVLAAPGLLTCTNTSLTLQAAGTDTGLNFLLTWELPDGTTMPGASPELPGVQEPGTYSLTVLNTQNGCSNTISVSVAQNTTPPDVSAGASQTITCANPMLTLNGSSTLPNAQYEWSTTNGQINAGANTPSPNINQPGLYTLQVTNLLNGCTASEQVQVGIDTITPHIQIALPGLLTCVTESLTLNATGSSFGGNLQVNWTTADGDIAQGAGTLTPLIQQPGTYLFSIANPDNGCSNSAQVVVQQNITPPLVNAGDGFTLPCSEDVSYLNASISQAGDSPQVQWTTANGSIVSGAQTLNPAIQSGGIYQLLIINPDNGCQASDQVEIVEAAPESLALSPRNPPCPGELGAIVIDGVSGGTPPYIYSIDKGVNFQTGTTFQSLPAGAYTVMVQDALGCEFASNAALVAPPEVQLNLETSVEIQLGDSYQLQTQVNYPEWSLALIQWTPANGLSCANCLRPIASPIINSSYLLQVVTTDGCAAEARVQILVNTQPAVFVPNVFSPNGDGSNDEFLIFAKPNSVREIRSLSIFSRWGEQVFQRNNFQPNDPAHGWDGRHRGQPLNPAVFIWWAEIEFTDGRIEILKGDVTLVR
jgi:gliding motility-associated-like protein